MTDLDAVRRATLDRIDRAERNYKLAVFAAALIELAFLAAFLLLADFGQRLHVLLLISTIATYTIIAIGLLAVGAWDRRNTLLVLKAMERTSS
ncbi:MAG TPA: hypothetical protein VG106_10915 [Vicinamibacterales bacterium]|nr:hypothetical protein [Vicinamibacterales bacterium]